MNSYTIVSLTIVAMATVCLAVPRPDDKYTSKYDNVDYKEVVGNERLFQNYVKCILEDGKCSPEAKELKDHISEALENECAKCTDKQKEGIKFVLNDLIKNKPDVWTKLKAKYDPSGAYSKKYEDRARAEGLIA